MFDVVVVFVGVLVGVVVVAVLVVIVVICWFKKVFIKCEINYYIPFMKYVGDGCCLLVLIDWLIGLVRYSRGVVTTGQLLLCTRNVDDLFRFRVLFGLGAREQKIAVIFGDAPRISGKFSRY